MSGGEGGAGGGGSGGGGSGGGGGGGLRSRELGRGPKWLQRAFNALRIDVIANRPVAGTGTTITESPNGRAINAGASAKSGGGGSGTLETVTGAVNGVPSTLNVLTDGAGWVEI